MSNAARPPAPNASDEWRQGWKLVLAASVGFSFFSVMTGGMGIYIGPFTEEFGWSRTLASSGLTISAIGTLLLSPFFGRLIDRYGSRPIVLPGLVALALSTAAFSLLNGSVVQWFALWIIYSLVALAVSVTAWSAAVASVFTAGRGLALGLTLTGTAVAQGAMPPLANWLIDLVGWRMSLVWIGVGWGGTALVLCWLFFFDAHDRRRAALQGAGPAVAVAAGGDDLPGLTIAQAWRDGGLWRIALSTFLLMVLTIGLLIHQVPILVEAGIARETAAWLAGLGGIAGIVGKLVTGALVDRYRANWVGGITLGATALAFALLLDGVRTPTLIVLAMVINGYSAGTKLQICSYLVSQYGGLRNFGAIYGAISSLVALGSALGPLLAGMVYDATGGYGGFLLAGAIGCVVCGVTIATLPRYPDWGASRGKDAGGKPVFA